MFTHEKHGLQDNCTIVCKEFDSNKNIPTFTDFQCDIVFYSSHGGKLVGLPICPPRQPVGRPVNSAGGSLEELEVAKHQRNNHQGLID